MDNENDNEEWLRHLVTSAHDANYIGLEQNESVSVIDVDEGNCRRFEKRGDVYSLEVSLGAKPCKGGCMCGRSRRGDQR